MIVKYFHENTDEDYVNYDEIWQINKHRMVFLQINLSHIHQLNQIQYSLDDHKDILAIRFPSIDRLKRNKIFQSILAKNSIIKENDKSWTPKEIWIYSPDKLSSFNS